MLKISLILHHMVIYTIYEIFVYLGEGKIKKSENNILLSKFFFVL